MANTIAECRKCGKILTSFIDPRQAFGPDKVIPPSILANAKVSNPLCEALGYLVTAPRFSYSRSG
jgi:lipid-binding SYLF domain-containing protein